MSRDTASHAAVPSLYEAGKVRQLLNLPKHTPAQHPTTPQVSARQWRSTLADCQEVLQRLEELVAAQASEGADLEAAEEDEEVQALLRRAVELLTAVCGDVGQAEPLCRALAAVANGPAPARGQEAREEEREALHRLGAGVAAQKVLSCCLGGNDTPVLRAALYLVAVISPEQFMWVVDDLPTAAWPAVVDIIVSLARDPRSRSRRTTSVLVRCSGREFLDKVQHELTTVDPQALENAAFALREECRTHGIISKKLEERIAARGNTDQIRRLKRQFQELDADDSGTIEVEELGPMLLSIGVNCTPKQLRQYMARIDEDKSGTIDWFEFMSFVFTLGDESQSLESRFTKKQLEDLRETFALFDRNGDGQISVKELGRMLKLLGQRVPPSALVAMIEEYDADGSGFMEWPEFLALMGSQMKDGDDEDEYVKAFKILDDAGRGFLMIKEVADRIQMILPGEISEQELRIMALEAKFEDNNLDRLTYKEFVKMMMNE